MSFGFEPLSPRVPLELVHLVFGYADKPTLFACMCVCHAWFEVARPYIYKQVVWRIGPEHVRWGMEDVLGAEHPLGLECLLQLLQDSPDICPLIQDLTLGIQQPSGGAGWDVYLDRGPRYCNYETFVAILRLLPSIHTVQINNLPFHTLPSPDLTSGKRLSLRALKLLSWIDSRHPESDPHRDRELLPLCFPPMFYGFLGLFDTIDEFFMTEKVFIWPLLPSMPFTPPEVKIRSLVLSHTEVLKALVILPGISHVDLPSPTRTGVPLMCELINKLMPSLRHVTLTLDSRKLIYFREDATHDYARIVQPLSPALAALPALEKLSLRMTVHGRLFENARLWERPCFHGPTYDLVVDMLRSLPRTTRHVQFIVLFERKPLRGSVSRVPVLAPLVEDWSALDDAIMEAIAQGVESVEAVESVDGRPLSKTTHNLLRERLPRTWAKRA